MTDILDKLRDVRVGEFRTVHYRVPQFDALMNTRVLKPYRVEGTLLYVDVDTVCIREDSGHERYVLTSYIDQIV